MGNVVTSSAQRMAWAEVETLVCNVALIILFEFSL